MNWELRQRLERVARRMRSLRLWTTLALCWLVWACIGTAIIQLAPVLGWKSETTVPVLAALAAFTAVIGGFAATRSARDGRSVARRIELRHPELASLLLTAVEQMPTQPDQGFGYLQHTVVRDAVQHGRAHDWTQVVSDWKIGLAKFAHLAALGLLVVVCFHLSREGALAKSAPGALERAQRAGKSFDVHIEPGNTELERGTALIVVAEFKGDVPADATLIVEGVAHKSSNGSAAEESATQQSVEAHKMSRPLDDPKFVGRVASVDRELSYYVESGTWRSEKFRVTMFEYPELVRADVKLEFPKYTGLDVKTIEDVRQVSAVEGTRITLFGRLNKPVVKAVLVDQKGDELELTPEVDAPAVYSATWAVNASRHFKLHLVDKQGRANRLPTDIVINVTPNRPPKIVVERPRRDTEVSPLEELQIQASITDDYGVVRGGVRFSLGGSQPREIEVFAADEPYPNAKAVEHLIEFESLAVEPDQLLSYFVWAEDFGVDGKPRRTMSDMFFAEVRHFEQIFRQGEQPPGGAQQQQNGSPNSQAATELAELQKEIVAATWKIICRETSDKPTAELAGDVQLVEESQQSAIDRAGELASRLEDEESIAHLKRAIEQMQTALKHVTSAAYDSTIDELNSALAAEQAAYQSLLKLRAREFQVVQGRRQQGGGAGSAGNRMQQQLNELELKAEDNRYETQSQARSTAEAQTQRDTRDILNRLRELARRQDDLNERLKELQSILQQAQTAEREKEIRRELKRLRDQQQQIMRDADEMIGQMDRSENRAEMDRARREAAESRSHLQQASEALEAGELSQALTEGTRAGRQLSDLRDDFRKQAANRFSQEMTDLRRDARQLDDEQQRLSNQLAEGNRTPGHGLRDTGARAEVQEGLRQQRDNLKDLTDRMQETVEEAEQTEPLLARQLYDTVRQAHQNKIADALDISQRLVEVGIEREAGQAMRTAGRGMGDLRRGVERAAESVLGDDTEALRRAHEEVQQLADELEREIAEANGEDKSDEPNEGQLSRNTDRSNGGGEQQSQRSLADGNPFRAESQEQPGSTPDTNENRAGDAGGDSPSSDRQASQSLRNQDGPSPASSAGHASQGAEQNDASTPSSTASRGKLRGGAQPNDRGRPFGQNLEELLGGAGGPGGPITGERFRDWSDRLRDVEEMLENSELRGEAARIRDRAQEARREYKRHAKMPDWRNLEQIVAEPLNELGQRLAEEIRRHESPDALVPIDRDPVPPEFTEQVRRYYERLGSGE